MSNCGDGEHIGPMGEDNGEDHRDLSHLATPQHHGPEVLLDDLSPLQIPQCKCWIGRGLLRRQSPRR